MPDTPTPVVNGHVVSLRLLQASMSTSSLTPAAAMLGMYGLTATAGSFCLFCENGDGGLPLVTRVSSVVAVAPATPTANATAINATLKSVSVGETLLISLPFRRPAAVLVTAEPIRRDLLIRDARLRELLDDRLRHRRRTGDEVVEAVEIPL